MDALDRSCQGFEVYLGPRPAFKWSARDLLGEGSSQTFSRAPRTREDRRSLGPLVIAPFLCPSVKSAVCDTAVCSGRSRAALRRQRGENGFRRQLVAQRHKIAQQQPHIVEASVDTTMLPRYIASVNSHTAWPREGPDHQQLPAYDAVNADAELQRSVAYLTAKIAQRHLVSK